MDIGQIIGCTLESCKFSKSSYAFELECVDGGHHQHLEVSTAHNISILGEKKVDVCSGFSKSVWDLLELKIVDVKPKAKGRNTELWICFEGGGVILIWMEGEHSEGLIVITDKSNGDWCTLF